MPCTQGPPVKPSARARKAAAITLSKGKMYEYGVPEEDHLDLPDDLDLEFQFPLAVGTLGDVAGDLVSSKLGARQHERQTPRGEVIFAAQVLLAVAESRLTPKLSSLLKLLAASAFYLGDTPGSAAALTKGLTPGSFPQEDFLARAIRFALDKPWTLALAGVRDRRTGRMVRTLRRHFLEGAAEEDDLLDPLRELRRWAYRTGSAHEVLLADILGAIAVSRFNRSAWTCLPEYSGLSQDFWRPYLSRPEAVKEMWPSQRMLGKAGLYRGTSAVVQMPTSAGKTRATELILRSAFSSGRTNLAVVVAPFRALCHEIANDLQAAFAPDRYEVNQLSDALQQDYTAELMGFFDMGDDLMPHVIVLTPEKLLYVLRQEPRFVENVGLIVYDEGHQFDTGSRGVTYELLLTSIKRLLSDTAQTVLISAVIKNAQELAEWLLGDPEKVVVDQWLQTRRLVAFASFPPNRLGQLQFDPALEGEQEFFVPRVIIPEALKTNEREKPRQFPTNESGSVALYLSLRLVINGGVAIYARMPASATKIVRDAVEQTFPRKPTLRAPAEVSDAGELQRLTHLFALNFGKKSFLTRGAALGLFVHHGDTPHGIRLAIEHAMRESLIRFIVCTSTLAQGVNLPIRYLLITAPMQGRDTIKARDFHNLIGRAGRAGMYGEGTVVFTDHKLFDERETESYKWEAAQDLLKADSATATGSTLLQLFDPLRNDNRRRLLSSPSAVDVVVGLIEDPNTTFAKFENISADLLKHRYSVDGLRKQLELKRSTIEAVESFLMTYRGDSDSQTFIAYARVLGRETLAYALGKPEQQRLIEDIFERIASRIERVAPDVDTQVRYGKTLFGVDRSAEIDEWVEANLLDLELTGSADELFEVLWPFLKSLSSNTKLRALQPERAARTLATGWLAGRPYMDLLAALVELNAHIQRKSRKMKLDVDAVVSFCEQTLGYEFALYVTAIKAAFVEVATPVALRDLVADHFDLLQKRLKYGLPSQDSISYFELGFAERVVAQDVASAIWMEVAKSRADARRFVREYSDEVGQVVDRFPSYFRSVYDGVVA